MSLSQPLRIGTRGSPLALAHETRDWMLAHGLAARDGSCRTPIGAHAMLEGDRVCPRGLMVRPEGSDACEETCAGPSREALARAAGDAERARLPAGFSEP